MSTILKRIKSDLTQAMTTEVALRKTNRCSGKDFNAAVDQKTVSRAIISMFPEIGVKPEKATDGDVQTLVARYVKNERTCALYQQKHLTAENVEGLSASAVSKLEKNTMAILGEKLNNGKVKIALGYLPKMATADEVKDWISANIEFSNFKNKMQAMKPIMTHFKGTVDGNQVRHIIEDL